MMRFNRMKNRAGNLLSDSQPFIDVPALRGNTYKETAPWRWLQVKSILLGRKELREHARLDKQL